jgi:hypothetical protein
MAQINVNPNSGPVYDDAGSARAAATNNLTWAIAVVLIIAALAIAFVFVFHSVHP